MAKAKKSNKHFLFEDVLKFLESEPSKQFNYKQVASALDITESFERVQLIEVLENLVKKDLIIEMQKGKFKFKSTKSYAVGKIDFTSTGAAYVVVEDQDQDIYIAPRKTADALHGDMVNVYTFPVRKGKKPEGEVVEVIERKRTDFVGTLQISERFAFLVPDSNKIHVDFFIDLKDILDAKNGQKVLARIESWRKGDNNPRARVLEVLGYPGENNTEINAIMAEFGLPMEFPKHIEKAAKALPLEITATEIARRRDFRDVLTFTIDPYDAKDFDDALSYKKLENGNHEIGVHIADVSHYIKPESILDKEAIERATSVYLVDRVVPMLPETLSNMACSLRPHEEKYTFSAVFEMDDNAKIVNEWFGKTVIYSDRRFTYEEVQEILEGAEGDHKEELHLLDRLAKKLRDGRAAKGSIFFDKEEVKFKLDENGKPLGVFFKTQKDAHKLIEDFMLLANKQVAMFLGKPKPAEKGKKNDPDQNLCVYRVHEAPGEDKMSELSLFVGKFGYKMNVKDRASTTASINKLLVDVKAKPEANMIELLAIRSMPKAYYTTENLGHYGLGFDYYAHFTSPIRRYPDVLVHRLLEAKINHAKYSSKAALEKMSEQSSKMEKLAAEAERASIKFKQVEYMSERIGQVFEGSVSGVTEWGIYVEIKENKCEGMIRVQNMKDDYYTFDPENYCYVGKHSKTKISLGDVVKVKVVRADIMKKQLDMEFVRDGEESSYNKPRDSKKPQKGYDFDY